MHASTMQVLRLNPQTRVEAKEKPRTVMTPVDRKRETRFFGTLGILFLYIITSCVLGWESPTEHPTPVIVPGTIARPEINSSASHQTGHGLIDAPLTQSPPRGNWVCPEEKQGHS